MIESIFKLKWVVSRHKQAPLLKEREQFLAHCQQQGTSHKSLHNTAPELIAVIRTLRTMYCIANTHLSRLGIQCPKRGPHSLRHACATRLLQQGASFKEIGDILGHRKTDSAGVYAKVDPKALRTVGKVRI